MYMYIYVYICIYTYNNYIWNDLLRSIFRLLFQTTGESNLPTLFFSGHRTGVVALSWPADGGWGLVPETWRSPNGRLPYMGVPPIAGWFSMDIFTGGTGISGNLHNDPHISHHMLRKMKKPAIPTRCFLKSWHHRKPNFRHLPSPADSGHKSHLQTRHLGLPAAIKS